MIVLGGKRWRKAVQSSDVDIEVFCRSLSEHNGREMSQGWGYSTFQLQVAKSLLSLAPRLSALETTGIAIVALGLLSETTSFRALSFLDICLLSCLSFYLVTWILSACFKGSSEEDNCDYDPRPSYLTHYRIKSISSK